MNFEEAWKAEVETTFQRFNRIALNVISAVLSLSLIGWVIYRLSH